MRSSNQLQFGCQKSNQNISTTKSKIGRYFIFEQSVIWNDTFIIIPFFVLFTMTTSKPILRQRKGNCNFVITFNLVTCKSCTPNCL